MSQQALTTFNNIMTENVAATTSNMEDELTNEVQSPPNPQKRISGKQRKATLEEYQHGAGSVQTVDRLGKDFGTGCLAGAAGAGKQVGVANAPGGNLVLQRRDDGGLPYNVSKALGAPFAV